MPKLRLGPTPEPPARKPRAKPPKPEPALFEQLFPCAWRGIVIPISSMRVTVSQDLVEHKYWGVDSASVEATGRAPMQIEATIPFVNGIVPGKGENFGVLYPNVFREFLKTFVDKTSGVLNHPELGGILCKPVSLDFAHDAQQRDGVTVTVRWVETIDLDDLDVQDPFNNTSPIQAAQLAALDLDASEIDCLALVPEAAFPEETFESMMGKATAFVDSATNTVNRIANTPKAIAYRVERLQSSVERARNALTWPVTEAAEKIKEWAWAQDANTHTVIGTGPKPPDVFKTPAAMTMAQILRLLPTARISDLTRLNPNLLVSPVIPAGSLVKYYA